jgi:hypothetical protein
MTVTLIKTVLPSNSIGRLGTIPAGLQSLPLKARNWVIGGIKRVEEPMCFQADKYIVHEEAPSSTKHR